jgi:hypothetical protein
MGAFNAGLGSRFHPDMDQRFMRGFGQSSLQDIMAIVGSVAPITTAVSAAENAPTTAAVSTATELIPLALVGFVIFLIVGASKKKGS